MNDRPILIENNALADFFVGEEGFKMAAENLRRKLPNWITSPLCRYEFGNVLRTYVRRGFVSEVDSRLLLRQGLQMVSFCSECSDEAILAEANASGLAFYNATYAASARALGCPFYTRDGDILKKCPEIEFGPKGSWALLLIE